MKLFVTGENSRLKEFETKLHGVAVCDFVNQGFRPDKIDFAIYDAIFDLNLDDTPENLEIYAHLKDMPVIASAVKMQLAEMVYSQGNEINCKLAGINALPTFVNRSKTEISVYKNEDKVLFEKLCYDLSLDTEWVDDRVGMVTPRLIFMIINEACYTLQEGTASAKDIDESMKLGVNYPYGPFEWCDRIGVREVYETLEAIYKDTHDERYKICPLLKTKYLRGEKFYI